ncbi:MAG TPA: FAD-binding oxidoreductase [Chloroflexota bacterium]|jgi:glycine/D-amino acid oxidase-like deaminating enzyme|nr:FAD-binding oxidoreductase [Chloroflexota bacterium]
MSVDASAAAATGLEVGDDSTFVRNSIYWRSTEPVTPGPPLDGSVNADVCVIGGGYTGMWAAHFLRRAEPSLSIHILESDYAGAGASGHNDGFVTPTIGHNLHTVVRAFSPERAKAGYAAVGRSILELRRFCVTNDIAAEYDLGGFYLVATNEGQRRRLEHDAELANSLGANTEILAAADIRARIDVPGLKAAIKTAGALVNPHRLARGLLRVVRAQGVEVHERTRALKVHRAGRRFEVVTPLGRVQADRLIWATNAYQQQWAPFRRAVLPVWSYVLVTEPLSDAQWAQVTWPQREGFVEARNFIVFARPVSGRRVLIGGGPAPYFFGGDMDDRRLIRDDIYAFLEQAFRGYFPAWRSVRFTHAYGGCIAMTRNLIPQIGGLGNGAFFAHGYCGNGIALSHTVGKVLRDLVLDRRTDYSSLPFVDDRPPRFPAEPFAFVGARAMSGLLRLQDRYPALYRWPLV